MARGGDGTDGEAGVITESTLAGDHRLQRVATTGMDELRIVDASGAVRVTAVITAQGVSLSFSGGDLSLRTEGDLAVEARRVSLHGRESLDLSTGGEMHLAAEGVFELEAHSQTLRTRRGDIALHANDDVRVDGERVLLNAPRS